MARKSEVQTEQTKRGNCFILYFFLHLFFFFWGWDVGEIFDNAGASCLSPVLCRNKNITQLTLHSKSKTKHRGFMIRINC